MLTMDELRYVDHLLKDDCVCACAAVTLFLHMHHIHAHWCATVVWCCSADTTIARIQYLCRQEVEALEAIGHKRLLLLTGEHPKYTFETFLDAVSVVRMHTCRCATQTSRLFCSPKFHPPKAFPIGASTPQLQRQNTPVHTPTPPHFRWAASSRRTPAGRSAASTSRSPPSLSRTCGGSRTPSTSVRARVPACVRACVPLARGGRQIKFVFKYVVVFLPYLILSHPSHHHQKMRQGHTRSSR